MRPTWCSMAFRKALAVPVALRPLRLTVPHGALVALLGPSGCGKTTTLRIIAGFEQTDTGRVLVGGADISRLPPNRRQLGMVFQNYSLFPHMTIAENVAFGLKMARIPTRLIAEQVARALATVRLAGMDARYPHQLSGGQQQRVALARSLVTNPKVLLLDEPLGALDKNLRENMQFELRQLQQTLGITTVLVTHDQEEALTMSDQVAVMRDGRLVQFGPPSEKEEDWRMTEKVSMTKRPPMTSSNRSRFRSRHSAASPAPMESEPVSPMMILAGAAFHQRNPMHAPASATETSARSIADAGSTW